jgi:hypothetical protein
MDRSLVEKKPHQVRMKLTGDLDGACDGNNVWDDAVKTFVPMNKLKEALHSEYEFIGGELSRQGFCNSIKRFLKGKRLRLKAKYLAGHTECPLHVQPTQWETLKRHWAVDGQVLKATKMAIARKHVKNVSSAGRKGKAGLEA